MLTGVGDLTGDGRNDMVGRVALSKRLYLFPGKGNGQFSKARAAVRRLERLQPDQRRRRPHRRRPPRPGGALGHLAVAATPAPRRAGSRPRSGLPGAWGGYDVLAGLGDLTNDGKADLVARKRDSGATFLYPGDGAGHLTARYGAFTSMAGMRFLVGAGSMTGSGANDLMGVDSDGRLRVFTNNGGRNVVRTTAVGRGFLSANLVLNVGDWNGDGHGDVVTRATDGSMFLYAGDGEGHFPKAVKMATGWKGVGLVAAVGDMTGDGYPDLMGQPAGSAMRIYPGNGATGFKTSYVAHSAISATKQVGIGRWNADGSPDTFVRRSDGTLSLYPGNGPGGLTGSGGTQVGSATKRYDWMTRRRRRGRRRTPRRDGPRGGHRAALAAAGRRRRPRPAPPGRHRLRQVRPRRLSPRAGQPRSVAVARSSPAFASQRASSGCRTQTAPPPSASGASRVRRPGAAGAGEVGEQPSALGDDARGDGLRDQLGLRAAVGPRLVVAATAGRRARTRPAGRARPRRSPPPRRAAAPRSARPAAAATAPRPPPLRRTARSRPPRRGRTRPRRRRRPPTGRR